MVILKKFILALILLMAIYILTIQKIFSQCSGTLVWADEFSGSSLDLTKWTYDLGNGCPTLCGWGNSELEYYTNSTNNVRVSGGNLIIEARNEAMGGSPFTSGKIKTLGLAGWTYGRFEARMRLPQGRGLWPAFWMLNENNNWPMTGEIDIMEYRGDMGNRTSGTLHYGNAWPNNQHDGSDYFLPAGNFYNEWHLFAVEWDADEIRWYLDDIRFKTETRTPNSLNPASGNDPWPWDEDFYIILNLAVGGWFTDVTNAADVELTKSTFEIDYVRVYDISTSGNYQTPYWGTAVSLPATIQAEEFDKGCGDAAFFDTEPANQGGQFRDEKVDIEISADAGGGYNVGWIRTGEWLEYTIDVPSGGTYNFNLRAASGTGGANVRIEMDGIQVAGPVSITNTGGWQNWQNFPLSNILLSSGTKVMRVYMVNGGFNLNYIDVSVNTLPVTLTGFFAQRVDNKQVDLFWETEEEINNSHFEIERSEDGLVWSVIEIKNGNGTTFEKTFYSFSDIGASEIGRYYRLKQVDLDGKHSYSSIVKADDEPQIYVTDTNSTITVTGTDKCIIFLFDCEGRLISSSQTSTLAKPMSPGFYILKVHNHSGIFVKKIMIQ